MKAIHTTLVKRTTHQLPIGEVAFHRMSSKAFDGCTNEKVLAQLFASIKRSRPSIASEQLWCEYRRLYRCYHNEDVLLDNYQ